MDTNYILNVLRNPYGKSEEEIKAARLTAADTIEEYHRRLQAAVHMAGRLADGFSNDKLSALGYQDFDEDNRRFMRLSNI